MLVCSPRRRAAFTHSSARNSAGQCPASGRAAARPARRAPRRCGGVGRGWGNMAAHDALLGNGLISVTHRCSRLTKLSAASRVSKPVRPGHPITPSGLVSGAPAPGRGNGSLACCVARPAHHGRATKPLGTGVKYFIHGVNCGAQDAAFRAKPRPGRMPLASWPALRDTATWIDAAGKRSMPITPLVELWRAMPPVIATHALAAGYSLLCGCGAGASSSGDGLHRVGWASAGCWPWPSRRWVRSGFRARGHLSWIHLLSVLTPDRPGAKPVRPAPWRRMHY